MRLDRLLGTLGKGTRSEAQRMIRRGEVSVNGQVCRDPWQSVDPETAGIALRGEALQHRRHVLEEGTPVAVGGHVHQQHVALLLLHR